MVEEGVSAHTCGLRQIHVARKKGGDGKGLLYLQVTWTGERKLHS